jgi:hypothetical protein
MQSLTELEAVNLMLSSIGESPVNDLTTEATTDVALARNILTDISREVQESGWHFNSETQVNILPDTDGFISLPLNTARVDISPLYEWREPDVVQRGTRLYNRDDQTFVFTTGVHVDLVVYLDWSDLPPAAKRYISTRAARVFASRVLGDQTTVGYTMSDEMEAKAILMSSESDTADYSILEKSEVGRSLRRF